MLAIVLNDPYYYTHLKKYCFKNYNFGPTYHPNIFLTSSKIFQ